MQVDAHIIRVLVPQLGRIVTVPITSGGWKLYSCFVTHNYSGMNANPETCPGPLLAGSGFTYSCNTLPIITT